MLPSESFAPPSASELLRRLPLELVDEIMVDIPLQSLRSLAHTSKFYRTSVDQLVVAQVTNLIGMFGVEFDQLKFVLNATGGVITGEVALLVQFPATVFHPLIKVTAMDIFISRRHYTSLIRFLTFAALYDIDKSSSKEDYFGTGVILQIFRLRRPASARMINVIVMLPSIDPTTAILSLPCTLLMNFISGQGTCLATLDVCTLTAAQGYFLLTQRLQAR